MYPKICNMHAGLLCANRSYHTNTVSECVIKASMYLMLVGMANGEINTIIINIQTFYVPCSCLSKDIFIFCNENIQNHE
jgi:hypothetical protein